MFYRGLWGTVCYDFWSLTNTHVACRQLGFSTSNTSWSTSSAGGWGVSTAKLQFAYNLLHLLNCRVDSYSLVKFTCHAYTLLKIYTVVCGMSLPLLKDWCSKNIVEQDFSQDNIEYTNWTMFLFSCSYGLATGTIWLDNVRCSGTESRLIFCSKSFHHNCNHYRDVAIDCDSSGIIMYTYPTAILLIFNAVHKQQC